MRTIALCLVLAGCGSVVTVPSVQIERVAPLASLLECPAEPKPDTLETLRDLARHHIDVAEAGQICRERLKGVKEWVDSQNVTP